MRNASSDQTGVWSTVTDTKTPPVKSGSACGPADPGLL